MDPTTTFCPNMACPARGQTGQGNIGIHSRKDRRFICTQCRKTFAATSGTVFYRLRTAGDLVALIITLRAHGCPVQAIVVAFGSTSERSRRGGHALAVRARPSRNIWSSNRGTSARCKPTRDVSRDKGAWSGWRAP